MKQIFIFLFSVFSVSCSAQNEFSPKNNELIYSDHTIKQLKFIVDSLNLKFKTCDLDKVYRAKAQVKGNYIFLSGTRAKEAKNDIEKNISFDDFIRKYPAATVNKDLLIVKFKYKDYNNADVLAFNSVELNNKYNYNITFRDNFANYEKPSKYSWVLNHQSATQYNEASISAFFFTGNFKENVLPLNYAKLLQYSECMIDTATQIFYQKAVKTGVRFSIDNNKKIEEVENYIAQKTLRPTYDRSENDEVFYKKMSEWRTIRGIKIDSLYKKDSYFISLFKEAVKEVIEKGGGNDDFEELVGLYYAKKTALELKRNRIVVGGCSMDDSPRIHAMNIAKLSAETAN